MATTLLPKARIGIKRTTINSSVLRELKPEKRGKSTNIERIGPKASFIDKLEGIRKFFLKKYESNLFSFVEGRKLREEEKIKKREEKLEKKSKRSILPTIGAPAPAKVFFLLLVISCFLWQEECYSIGLLILKNHLGQ